MLVLILAAIAIVGVLYTLMNEQRLKPYEYTLVMVVVIISLLILVYIFLTTPLPDPSMVQPQNEWLIWRR